MHRDFRIRISTLILTIENEMGFPSSCIVEDNVLPNSQVGGVDRIVSNNISRRSSKSYFNPFSFIDPWVHEFNVLVGLKPFL
jgi:hypothetical protein